jgi:alkanesulfonate monooxygenase SsuD/methylene tetrahydromethanopterin reductase-like flavin-dependent oxidoreductase (luciferase family)
MSPSIGVRLAPRVDQIGEFLADVRALDANGAAALWIEGDEDPWMLLAAAAVVTSHIKLVAPCSAAEVDAPDRLARRVATLQLLAHHRVVLGVDDAALVEPVMACVDAPLLFDVQAGAPPVAVSAVVRAARGWLLPGRVPADLRADREAVLAARRAQGLDMQGLDRELEFWAGVPVPTGRAEWRRSLAEQAAAGATGVVVPHDPRLLDLLRNPDSDGNRSDLQLAQG